MRHWKRWSLGLAAVAGISACATAVPRELQDARYAYQRAAASPAAQYQTRELNEARKALEAANRSFNEDESSEQTRSLAYVALRKADLARVKANTTVAQRERMASEAKLQQLSMARQRQTQEELAAARGELTEAQRLQAEAQARHDQTEQQRLREEEMRAQAEKDAEAKLQKISELKIKEEARGKVLTLSGSVLFTSGQSILLPTAQQRLDQVADALKSTPNHLLIEGHTDSQGSVALNDKLSTQRADAVRDYLERRGIARDRVRAVGLGENQPVADNSSPEGRANNRRVEIVIERSVASTPQAPSDSGVGGGGEGQ